MRDFVVANITLKKGLSGAKPDIFNLWIFEVLGAQEGDELDDLFSGTGGVMRDWQAFQSGERKLLKQKISVENEQRQIEAKASGVETLRTPPTTEVVGIRAGDPL